MKHNYSLSLLAMVLGVIPAMADDTSDLKPISAASLDGSYWAVQDDWFYGRFQHLFQMVEKGENQLRFSDYPTEDSFGVDAMVLPKSNEVVIPTGQVVYQNDYGDNYYIWNAAPDDPTYNYDVNYSSELRFNVDPETNVLSWDASQSEDGSRWLNFYMMGKYYQVGLQQYVAGSFHFIKVRLYPIDSEFNCTRTSDATEFSNPLRTRIVDGKLVIYGILNLDHDAGIVCSINKDSNTLIVEENLICDNDEYGTLNIESEEDVPLSAEIVADEFETVLNFKPFRLVSPNGQMSAGHYENATAVLPYDLYSRVDDTTSSLNCIPTVEASQKIRYFNLQGVEINGPASGFYIEMNGNKATKRLGK